MQSTHFYDTHKLKFRVSHRVFGEGGILERPLRSLAPPGPSPVSAGQTVNLASVIPSKGRGLADVNEVPKLPT